MKRMTIQDHVHQQRQWIQEHGATLSGYIRRYGWAGDPDRYGDGGVAIYEADTAYLRALEQLAAAGHKYLPTGGVHP